MISTRVLDILRTPDSIVADDITLLEKEIKLYPYVQSLRALYLLGTHKFYPDNFQKVLSETAAYTTDKKILYQLINKKPVALTPVPFVEEEEVMEQEIATSSSNQNEEEEVSVTAEVNSEESNTEVVEEINEAEEVTEIESTFAEIDAEDEVVEETELVNIESTEEIQPTFVQEELIVEDEDEESTDEAIESEDILSSEEVTEVLEESEDTPIEINEVEKSSEAELSFHGMDEFLPNVKIEANHAESLPEFTSTVSNEEPLSPEDEMKRLIEAVEQKMKETKPELSEEEDEEPTYLSGEINFAEGYLEPAPEETKVVDVEEAKEVEVIQNIVEESIDAIETKTPEVNTEWKPLSFESNTPDALLNKAESLPQISTERVVEAKKEEVIAEIQEIQEAEEVSNDIKAEEKPEVETKPVEEDRPVMNVSFMATPSPSLSEVPTISKDISAVTPTDSNVPNFINTWQSWLRIDRVEASVEEKVDVEDIKNQAIETFIENEPRISQLKDEVTFVVKEKSDDISHLMTETLARLYIEQKLYTKAIKSFKILINKHPEKESYYKDVIKEIKEMRPRF